MTMFIRIIGVDVESGSWYRSDHQKLSFRLILILFPLETLAIDARSWQKSDLVGVAVIMQV